MRIMYLLFSFTIGGTERLVADICNEMVKSKNEVFLYIVNDNYSQELLQTISSKVHINLQKRQMGSHDKFQTLKKISAYVRQNMVEVIHCNSFEAPELLILSNFVNRNTRVIHTIHDVGQYRTLNFVKKIYRNFTCDMFVAISETVKKDIIMYGAAVDKVRVIYNAIDLMKFAPKGEKQYNEAHITIGNVARINLSKKGQDLLVRATAELNRSYNVECYFAGGADEAHQEDLNMLKQLALDLGIESKVHFCGSVNDIPEFLSKLDIFVLPSRFEGFGISLIESMAMEIPCIASELDGPAEIIGKNLRGYLFAKDDVKALVETIEVVISNYKEEKLNCEKVREFVTQSFDIKKMCDNLKDVYRA